MTERLMEVNIHFCAMPEAMARKVFDTFSALDLVGAVAIVVVEEEETAD